MIAFLEWLPITKGVLTGNKMKLLPEQREFVEAVYGSAIVRIAVLSEPRGNGKTGLLSGLALCHLIGPEAEPRGEVYSCAIDRAQAALLFAEMEAIIRQVPEFDELVNIVRVHKRMEVLHGDGTGSVYEALSADARRGLGLSPTMWVYDELAQAKDRLLLDNLITAQGKRARSLGVVISTQAPRDDHPLSQLIDDGLRGTPGIHVKLIAAPDDADPFDPVVIATCNPAVGHFLMLDELLHQAEQARRMPAFEARFRNLRLNQRIAQDAGFVSPLVWGACGADPLPAAFDTGPVYIGLDLSSRSDLTALVYCAHHENAWHVRAEFFAPREGLYDRATRDRTPYDQWARDGHLTLCPGHTVDYEIVAQRLVELCDDFDVASIAFDRWRIDVLQKELERLGATLPLIGHGQGFKDMSAALDTLEAELLNTRVRHGDNPVLSFCASNAIVDSDPAGNRKLSKLKSNGKIDGIVALAMALNRHSVEIEPTPEYQALFIGPSDAGPRGRW